MEVRGQMKWVLFICYIFGHIIISHNNGFIEAKSLSQFEELEIQKKLKTINKPAIKIIKTINGELYGCVDFFKQPAFDHPSMKNHTYHYKMRPTLTPEGMREVKTNNSDNKFGYLWENGVGCPIGTVPIQRVTKDDLLRLNSLDDNSKPRGSWNTTNYDSNNVLHYDQHHYAVSRTKKNLGLRFNGATMDLCVTAPMVKPKQYSSTRIHMQLGNDFIQAGITINPVLYKDNAPRTFVYTYAKGKSCYNGGCDVGFISVRSDYPIGMALKNVAVRGAKSTPFVAIGLIKDKANGNWWLQIGGNAEQIGFWPSQRFAQSYGNLVEWGGEVYSANQPSPQMGNGHFPSGNMRYDSYMKRLTILDESFSVDRKINYLEEFSDDDRGYQIIRQRYSSDSQIGLMVLYGGPGNI